MRVTRDLAVALEIKFQKLLFVLGWVVAAMGGGAHR